MFVKRIIKEFPDGSLSLAIEIDGKPVWGVWDGGEKQSNSVINRISRDGERPPSDLGGSFSACVFVGQLIEQAYNAGKNGEDLYFASNDNVEV